MNETYSLMKYIYDFNRPLFLMGRQALRKRIVQLQPKQVLEIGSGTARNLIVLAKKCQTTTFTGLDISSEMIDFAKLKVKSAQLESRIKLIQADATQIEHHIPHAEKPDLIFFSFSLSMIPDWQVALKCALEQVKATNATILIVDFSTLQAWPSLVRRLFYVILKIFHTTPRLELDAFLARDPTFKDLLINKRRFFGGYASLVEIKVSKPLTEP